MECRNAEKLVDAYLDRELSPQGAKELEGHLAGCPVCRSKYGHLIAILASPTPVEVPAGLRDRITTAVETRMVNGPLVPSGITEQAQAERPTWGRLTRSAWFGAIAASLVFFLMGWAGSLLWTQSHRAPVTVPEKPKESVTIVLSPWLMQAWAQAVTSQGAVNPVVFVMSAATTELALNQQCEAAPAIRIFQRPKRVEPAPDQTNPLPPEMQLLPLTPRPIGV